ncbi:hypothetical protein BC477_11155 [Clavibacter michiganensis subsp. michiganensis]|uniref:VanZ-like domain-containing protein n=1 Tax=Clavibacter michiganensis subsp. michiganensis TaxID=33013 RepID=A0A251XHU0_CLAMM|nr:hypothetical protein BC477_11155 [Clavibacter michiganensis subsp. michiganensis]OUE02352.1 hypothetical protein CMMCAS07_10070 [Clavibacter michiganensis subsp. michiganensis]
MFVPVGMFLVLLLGRSRWWLAIALGVGLSALIETAQAFLPRASPTSATSCTTASARSSAWWWS